jgi:hypothetical protein
LLAPCLIVPTHPRGIRQYSRTIDGFVDGVALLEKAISIVIVNLYYQVFIVQLECSIQVGDLTNAIIMRKMTHSMMPFAVQATISIQYLIACSIKTCYISTNMSTHRTYGVCWPASWKLYLFRRCSSSKIRGEH